MPERAMTLGDKEELNTKTSRAALEYIRAANNDQPDLYRPIGNSDNFAAELEAIQLQLLTNQPGEVEQ